MIGLASVSLLVSLIMALLAFWTKQYSTAPDFAAVTARIQGTESWFKWRFLPNLADAINTNDRKLQQKSSFLKTALSGLCVLVLDVSGYLINLL